MRRYITLDGGTTNTRLYLVEDNKIIDFISLGIGCGNKESALQYSEKIKNGISELLTKNSLSENDIHRILASGMVTSELGLITLEHKTAPAGIEELCENSREITLEGISKIPFFFISGIKTVGESLDRCDIMRGEETEVFGITGETGGEGIYVLPGSHSKIIRIDTSGKITDFKSTLTGEMICVLSKGTILSDAVDITLSEINSAALIEGYEFTAKFGINASLLKPRVLKNIYKKDRVYTYSFFIGTVLCDEVKAILLMPEKRVTIGGRAEIKRALALLLENFSDKEIVVLDEVTVLHSTVYGALKIFEHYEKIHETRD